MKKYKHKIIAAIVVITILLAAWFFGGMPTIHMPDSEDIVLMTEHEADINDSSALNGTGSTSETNDDYETVVLPHGIQGVGFDVIPDVANMDHFTHTPEGVVVPDVHPNDVQIFTAHHPNMRAPLEPEDIPLGDEQFTVILSVRAHMILYNMHLLHRDKHELVPEDGWIFPPTEVVAYAGESVFNVLQREMRRNQIHMVARWTPIFNSAYVEAINNLFEFDVGPLSGWMYRVNGWFPNFGASRYMLEDGDVIEWIYTVDLGRDLGVHWLGGE